MQTILGASGQIAQELARELKRAYTDDLRLVSRNPKKVNDSDTLVAADLLDAQQTLAAVKGSDVVYFAAGLPPDSALWERQFPTMLPPVTTATSSTANSAASIVSMRRLVCGVSSEGFSITRLPAASAVASGMKVNEKG